MEKGVSMILQHHDYVVFNNDFLTDEEVEVVRQYASTIPTKLATTVGYDEDTANFDLDKLQQIRDSNLKWLKPDEKLGWLWYKIRIALEEANKNFFKFDIGSVEDLQYTIYKAPGGHYTTHRDLILPAYPHRKISFTIQLTDENQYEGGEVLIYQHSTTDPHVALKKKGSITMFLSLMLHEVKPVTKGSRESVVGWVMGPPLK